MLAGFLWGGKPAKFRKEILEYPYDLGGLQLHNLQRFSSSLKIIWLRRIIATDSSWTTFAISYEIDKADDTNKMNAKLFEVISPSD